MMRQPTPREDLYYWHGLALRGLQPPITMEPEAGWFVTRFSLKGGPIPASIWLEQPIDAETGELIGPEKWRAEILGEEMDPEEVWMKCAKRPVCRSFYLELLGKLL